MDDNMKDEGILKHRERMIERRPGLLDSFERFVRDFKKYKNSVNGSAPNRRVRRKPGYGRRNFQA